VRLLTVDGNGLILAHGIGGSTDLPIPRAYALVGATCALAVSFVILGFAWRTSRFRGDESGRPIPRALEALVDSRLVRDGLRLLGLAFTGYVAMAAFLGEDLLTNPTFGVVYVLLWVGMVALSVLLGPVWPLLSPVRTIHLVLTKALHTNPRAGVLDYPERLGY
jgi:small-conductance mechanosensitive channel